MLANNCAQNPCSHPTTVFKCTHPLHSVFCDLVMSSTLRFVYSGLCLTGVILLSLSVILSAADGVRSGPAQQGNVHNGVRSVAQPVAPVRAASSDQSVSQQGSVNVTSSGNSLDTADAVTASSNPETAAVNAGTSNPDSFEGIRNQFVGGMTAIRDSAGKLIGFAAGTVVQGVESAVRPVVEFGGRVVNRTVQIKDNIGNAGSAIAHTWGQSIKDTANITGQLVGR